LRWGKQEAFSPERGSHKRPQKGLRVAMIRVAMKEAETRSGTAN